MQYIDVHAHYDDEKYAKDLEQELQEVVDAGVIALINAGSNICNSKRAVELANKHSYIYATVGIHPECIDEIDRINEIEELYLLNKKSNKIVAIGEIGLDFHYETYDKKKQIEGFISQLKLAKKYNLPVQIHSRDAVDDMLKLINQKDIWPHVVMFHCFELNPEITKQILKNGWYISLGGNITYKRSVQAIEQIKKIPLEKIMLETDAPYLTPDIFRGKRNSSKYIYKVAEKISEIKGCSLDEVSKTTTNTAKKIYGLKSDI